MEPGFDDPSDFKSKEFGTLDEHMRCPICKEIFTDIMMLSKCSHSFCALCIRRCLSAEQVCPKCRKQSHESQLIHNYDLDNVVRSWKQSRKLILHLENNSTKSSNTASDTPMDIGFDVDQSDEYLTDDEFLAHMTTTTARRSTRLQGKQTSPQPQYQNMAAANVPQMNRPTAADNVTPTSAAASGSNRADIKLTSSSMVQCPVCMRQMKFAMLDRHIDQCTSSTPSQPSTHPLSNKPVKLGKKPVKQVYNMLSDKQLSELLRSFNLPEHGDRATKIWRHKEYVNLYNANADSNHPVSAQVLVQRLIAIERTQSADKINQLKRKAADPTEHKAKYADHFSALIQTAKKNRPTKIEDDKEKEKQS